MDKTELLSLSYKAARLQIEPENVDEADLQKFLTFTDKESYLKWVADWKAEYKELSSEIRTLRQDTKRWQKAGRDEAGSMQAKLSKQSRIARMMIVVRKAGKRHSWGMRNAAKVESIEPVAHNK